MSHYTLITLHFITLSDQKEYFLMMNRLARVGSSIGTTTEHRPVRHSNSSAAPGTPRHSKPREQSHSGSHTQSRRGLFNDSEVPYYDYHPVVVANDLELVAPLTVHANYCGTKHKCFMDRGLWLLETYKPTHINMSSSSSSSSPLNSLEEDNVKFRCKAYNKEDTLYNTHVWKNELNDAEDKLIQYLKRFKVGDVVRYGRNPEIYILDYPDSKTSRKSNKDSSVILNTAIGLRSIPNMVTLDKLGFPDIVKLSDVLPSYMTIGRDILDLTETNLSYTISSNLSFLDIYGLYKTYEHSRDSNISTNTG